MPRLKSAKKKERQDKRKRERNLTYEKKYKDFIKKLLKVKKSSGKLKEGDISRAYSLIDKARKNGVIHKNKAARLKARIAKLTA